MAEKKIPKEMMNPWLLNNAVSGVRNEKKRNNSVTVPKDCKVV